MFGKSGTKSKFRIFISIQVLQIEVISMAYQT